jgi:hypothetical protein
MSIDLSGAVHRLPTGTRRSWQTRSENRLKRLREPRLRRCKMTTMSLMLPTSSRVVPARLQTCSAQRISRCVQHVCQEGDMCRRTCLECQHILLS